VLARGIASSGPRHREHHRRGEASFSRGRRPNVMIKIPATKEGLPAIRTVLGAGHQRQRHADLLPRALRGGHHGLDRGTLRRDDAGKDVGVDRERRVVLRVARRRGVSTRCCPRVTLDAGTTANAQVAAAYRALPPTRGERPTCRALLRQRRAGAAPAVGLDLDQEPGLRSTCSTSTASWPTRPSTPCPTRRWPTRWITANFSTSLLLNDETCHETAAKRHSRARDLSLAAVTDKLETDGVARL
jgi:hypothetical protein